VDEAVFGAGHPWGRPAVGSAATVRRLRPSEVDAFLRSGFTADRAVIAIVGPVPRDAGEALSGFMEPGPLRATEVDAPTPATEPVRQSYQAITAWVAAAYPFGEDADEEAIRMLARLALQRVSFGVQRPQVYDSRAEVVRHAGGGELRIELVVPPSEAEEWGGRVRQAVAEYAGAPLPDAMFADRLRRFRGERLLELESPEARARALARDVLLGLPTARLTDADALTPQRLRAAAQALGDPVIVYLGPFEEDKPAAGRE
jgi:predicted Zn-dependent peptidase